MKIDELKITIKELVDGFSDNGDKGVTGYSGKLDIRPPYQREFIYSQEQQVKVIETVMMGFPLNTMYWVKKADGNFEVLDGQQRTMSICSFWTNQFSYLFRNFESLQNDEKEKFLSYPLTIYVCEGEDSEKLNWFRTINIAGIQLKDQEIRNAVYSGSWVTSAKTYFSKKNCAAYNIAKNYISGECNRQDYLETAIKWMSGARKPTDIDEFMTIHKNDADAQPLWTYFQGVIDWVKAKFSEYRPTMKGIDWGDLYRQHKDRTDLKSDELEKEVSRLFADEDVTNKKGIYAYVLNPAGNEKLLSIRAFLERDKQTAYEKQGGKCALCGEHFEIQEMQADHIKPWSKGGKTIQENCQMLCTTCNLSKSDR